MTPQPERAPWFAPWFPNYPASVVPDLPSARTAFEKYFEIYGGRCQTALQEDGVLDAEWFKRRFWDYLKKFSQVKLYKSALSNIYIDYIDNPRLNAALGQSENFVFVGVFLGAFRNLATFFQVLLSHPDVFPDVGDPSKQIKWFDNLVGWNWSLSVVSAFDSFESLAGTKPVFAKGARSVFAGYLTMFTLDFLFFHEIGHWCYGHDKFQEKMGGKHGIADELESFQLPPIPNQLLELNADSFAVTLMTNEWFHMPPGPTSIFQSALEALRVWTIAITFTFMLIGQEQKIRVIRNLGLHPHPDLMTPHPHPMMRLVNARQVAMGTAHMVSSEAASIMFRAWNEALTVVRESCERLKIPSTLWYADEETVTRTYQAICMEWAMLYQSDVNACTRLKY